MEVVGLPTVARGMCSLLCGLLQPLEHSLHQGRRNTISKPTFCFSFHSTSSECCRLSWKQKERSYKQTGAITRERRLLFDMIACCWKLVFSVNSPCLYSRPTQVRESLIPFYLVDCIWFNTFFFFFFFFPKFVYVRCRNVTVVSTTVKTNFLWWLYDPSGLFLYPSGLSLYSGICVDSQKNMANLDTSGELYQLLFHRSWNLFLLMLHYL